MEEKKQTQVRAQSEKARGQPLTINIARIDGGMEEKKQTQVRAQSVFMTPNVNY